MSSVMEPPSGWGDLDELSAGETVSATYRLEKRLGKGAMGEVWLATHLLLNQPRAIKIMLGAVSADPAFRELFIQGEARNALRLDRHPNIVRIYELGQYKNIPFIVMEYVVAGSQGGDLKELLSRFGRFSPEEVGKMLYQVAGALEVAHRQGLVHRDIKPANILVDAEGQLKLGDFGLTMDLNSSQKLALDASSAGTPSYMAPEQASGKVDIRSDIYSLGVVVYLLLSGKTPFQGGQAQLIYQHANMEPPSLVALNPAIPAAVEKVVMKALAKKPEERWSTAREMALAYRQALGEAAPVEEGAKDEWLGLETNLPPCPYRGLFAFQEEDAALFFGREAFTRTLREAVHKMPVVSVVGPSGSGKSSVVYAGLLPALRQEGNWFVLNFRPGEQPFLNLALSLLPWLNPSFAPEEGTKGRPSRKQVEEAAKMAGGLFNGAVKLAQLASSVQQRLRGARLLLVVDQFEELFTLCRNPMERERFLNEILSQFNASGPGGPGGEPLFNIVLTLRADFMGYALSHRMLADALQQSQLNLGPMNRPELQKAVEGPAARMGVRFEDGLVKRILDTVGERPGDLPLLEFALTLLWERQRQRRLTHAAYTEMGGVELALSSYAEEVYGRLFGEDRARMQQIFLQLVRPGVGTADTRRVASRSELGDANWPLVTQLANLRLIVTGQDETNHQETVEVVHEALINRWQRLRDWIAGDRQFRTWQERLRSAQKQWEVTKQDEGGLLRGAALAEAVEWLQRRQEQLSPAEQAFIRQSEQLRERELTEKVEREKREADRAAQEQQRVLRDRTRRRVTIGIIGALIVVAVLAVVAVLQAINANDKSQIADTQRQVAQKAQAQAETSSQEAVKAQAQAETSSQEAQKQRQLARSLGLAAQANSLSSTQPDLAALLSLESLNLADTPAGQSSLTGNLNLWSQLTETLRGDTSGVDSLAFSPDGKVLASGDEEGNIVLWDWEKRQPTAKLKAHVHKVTFLAFSPDGKRLASISNNGDAASDNLIVLWDLANNNARTELKGHQNAVMSVAFSPDGKLLASASRDLSAILWDLEKGTQIRKIASSSNSNLKVSPATVAFSPDGVMLGIGGLVNSGALLNISDPANPKIVGQIETQSAGVNGVTVAFTPDRTYFLLSAGTSTLFWDISQRKTVKTFTHGAGFLLSPDGKKFVSEDNNNVDLWDVNELDNIELEFKHPVFKTGNPAQYAFSQDSNKLISANPDSTISVWDLTNRGLIKFDKAPDISTLALSPDNKTVVSGKGDGTIQLWDTANGKQIGKFGGENAHSQTIQSLAFSPDGKVLASGSNDKTVIIWDIGTRTQLAKLNGHTGEVLKVAFSPDGKTLASGGTDTTIILWDVGAKTRLGTLEGKAGEIQELVFSPDGKSLISGSCLKETVSSGCSQDQIILWNLADRSQKARWSGQQKLMNGLAVSPDGKVLAEATHDRLFLWNLVDQAKIGALESKVNFFDSVIFSRDGKMLAVYDSPHGTVRLLDAATGIEVASLKGVVQYKNSSIAFTMDGNQILGLNNTDNISLWNLNFDFWKKQSCSLANRNLTQDEWKFYLGTDPYRKTCSNLP